MTGKAKKQPRQLPGFSKWATGLWAFSPPGSHTVYFASRDVEGRWQVVSQDDESKPLGPGGRTKAAAVRAALDVIDSGCQDQAQEAGAA
ncbi:hypothetical protein ACFV42_46405 [Streptomyces solisilvae]|uniref:hypothetical protein n=1 Tax=Streptomyces malaysiensis TaxID=92644 RepID=UPI00369FA55B